MYTSTQWWLYVPDSQKKKKKKKIVPDLQKTKYKQLNIIIFNFAYFFSTLEKILNTMT